MKKRTLTRLPSIACPDCGGKMIARSSEVVTAAVREVRLECADLDCRASFVGQIALIRSIRRGPRVNPEVRLPFSTAAQAAQRPTGRPANENHRDPANDDAPPPAKAVDPMTG